MKHLRIYTAIGLCLILAMPIFPNGLSNLGHFFTVGTSLGYSNIFEDYPNLHTTGATGGTFGINYELRKKTFVFTTGLEGQFVTSNSLFSVTGIDTHIYDTQGKIAIMHYQTGDIVEKVRLFYTAIPIMFGYYNYGLFVGGGVKIGIPTFPTVKCQYSYTTSATYSEYIDDFVNMNNHHYGAYDRLSNYQMKVPVKYSIIMEIGYNVLNKMINGVQDHHHGLRISAICEYGINNLANTSDSRPLYEINPTNATELTILPYYATHSSNNQHINHFYAGIKITWTFRASKGDCNCD